jgi:hypothetical protein
MAELLEKIVPTEATYKIELTQSELDFMVGIMSDLSDNPQRRVRMIYEIDESYVEPTALGYRAAKAIYTALSGLDCDDYDYDDYWTEVKPQAEWLGW